MSARSWRRCGAAVVLGSVSLAATGCATSATITDPYGYLLEVQRTLAAWSTVAMIVAISLSLLDIAAMVAVIVIAVNTSSMADRLRDLTWAQSHGGIPPGGWGRALAPTASVGLGPAQLIQQVLQTGSPLHVDQIAMATGLDPATVAHVTSGMVAQGVISRDPGGLLRMYR